MFLHGFCEFYAFFPHFLSQQQLGINFFGFAGIFYAGLSLFRQLRSRKWCVMMRKWAKIMKNHLFLPIFQFFSHLLSSQLLGTPFFGFLANFCMDMGCFSKLITRKLAILIQIGGKSMKKQPPSLPSPLCYQLKSGAARYSFVPWSMVPPNLFGTYGVPKKPRFDLHELRKAPAQRLL